MTARHGLLVLVAAGVLLTGCASTAATTRSATPAAAGGSMNVQSASGHSMSGMPMTSGSTATKPTATALMICSDDIKGKVRQVLKLAAEPQTTSSFANEIYSCTYHLPVGPLVLSVQHSPTKTSAMTYFNSMKSGLGRTDVLFGLGDNAYGTPTGVTVVVKDNESLTVDARGVPAVFGSDQQRRTDLANEIASDVLGCWTGGD